MVKNNKFGKLYSIPLSLSVIAVLLDTAEFTIWEYIWLLFEFISTYVYMTYVFDINKLPKYIIIITLISFALFNMTYYIGGYSMIYAKKYTDSHYLIYFANIFSLIFITYPKVESFYKLIVHK
jgi:hypothetical protein